MAGAVVLAELSYLRFCSGPYLQPWLGADLLAESVAAGFECGLS